MLTQPLTLQVELTDTSWITLKRSADTWQASDLTVKTPLAADSTLTVIAFATTLPLARIKLTWPRTDDPRALFLGDAFERAYGDLRFTPLDEEAVYYWYMMETNTLTSTCWGVKTQPNAFCAWTVAADTISLWLDVRSGTNSLNLANRTLTCCTVLQRQYQNQQPLACLTDFCRQMNADQQVPKPAKVIGTNDWYYAYGNNNKQDVLSNAKAVVGLCQGLDYQPWVVIDDGWQLAHSQTYNGGPWTAGNKKFGDMAAVAKQIKTSGARPGLWFRPLLTKDPALKPFALSHFDDGSFILDISTPEVLAKVAADIRRFTKWGFELIKYDFTSVDTLRRLGPNFGLHYTGQALHFQDQTRTTAEILKGLYRTVKAAAGSTMIMGCNVASHLAAGLIDVMRIGDDTSGRLFHRTVAMGVNSLAFRMPQHNTFYLADADCVGITPQISWAQNKQWLDLLAASGTVLLVSCDFNTLTSTQRQDIAAAFKVNFQQTKPLTAVNAVHGRYPTTWQNAQQHYHFDWHYDPLQSL